MLKGSCRKRKFSLLYDLSREEVERIKSWWKRYEMWRTWRILRSGSAAKWLFPIPLPLAQFERNFVGELLWNNLHTLPTSGFEKVVFMLVSSIVESPHIPVLGNAKAIYDFGCLYGILIKCWKLRSLTEMHAWFKTLNSKWVIVIV